MKALLRCVKEPWVGCIAPGAASDGRAPHCSAVGGARCRFAQSLKHPLPPQVCVPSRETDPHAVARAICPSDYPSASPPVVELLAPHLPADLITAAAEQLEALFAPGGRGDECVGPLRPDSNAVIIQCLSALARPVIGMRSEPCTPSTPFQSQGAAVRCNVPPPCIAKPGCSQTHP